MKRLVRFDWAMKYLLRNKANFDILEGFLTELLKTPIKIEHILESESNKNTEDDKFNRVDILVHTEQNEKIIVEIQCSSQWDYLSRILYGTSKVVCEFLKEGESYENIQKVISVSIVFFNMGSGKDYLYHGTTQFKGLHCGDVLDLNSKEQELYAQHYRGPVQTSRHIFPEYYLIKVQAFHEKVQDKFDEWVHFLKTGEIKPEFKAKGLKSAARKLDILSLNDQERRRYDVYKEASHDTASFESMLRMERRGGLKEGKEEIAQNMLKKAMDIDLISTLTGLSIEEIKALV